MINCINKCCAPITYCLQSPKSKAVVIALTVFCLSNAALYFVGFNWSVTLQASGSAALLTAIFLRMKSSTKKGSHVDSKPVPPQQSRSTPSRTDAAQPITPAQQPAKPQLLHFGRLLVSERIPPEKPEQNPQITPLSDAQKKECREFQEAWDKFDFTDFYNKAHKSDRHIFDLIDDVEAFRKLYQAHKLTPPKDPQEIVKEKNKNLDDAANLLHLKRWLEFISSNHLKVSVNTDQTNKHTPDQSDDGLISSKNWDRHDYMATSDAEKESRHDYIQWCFIMNCPSKYNDTAPILIGKEATDILANLKMEKSLLRKKLYFSLMGNFIVQLKFYGIEAVRSKDHIEFVPAQNFLVRFREWGTAGNHNHLRITRMLHSAYLVGLEAECHALRKFLQKLAAFMSKKEHAKFGIKNDAANIRASFFHFWRIPLPYLGLLEKEDKLLT